MTSVPFTLEPGALALIALMAVLYARDPRAGAEYVAEKLDFESDSAYRRAFRRWKERGLV